MKKVIKFFLGLSALAAAAAGAYYVYKNYFEKKDTDSSDDFDEEDDDFDCPSKSDSREYVSINITSEETPDEEAGSDPVDSADVPEQVTDPENQ